MNIIEKLIKSIDEFIAKHNTSPNVLFVSHLEKIEFIKSAFGEQDIYDGEYRLHGYPILVSYNCFGAALVMEINKRSLI